ncbi:hypothetical protein [Pseudobacteroides cellulosolvens]|uniref:Dockerin domain-containing protein n=1 Tax=Pseudobacteroides cellulosolvens ATCC 35603 = DSM 2933 TaxID=398512 RepID=A0A0L6JMP4_9FIRM|nr:hypothetical protein [Pseudobacteroides cellulosolvens]KNY27035.1 hypothetical protein Bccel_2300 [Pseudobacteroides cellulosolvens ATCC 35603 = DSM 2933]
MKKFFCNLSCLILFVSLLALLLPCVSYGAGSTAENAVKLLLKDTSSSPCTVKIFSKYSMDRMWPVSESLYEKTLEKMGNDTLLTVKNLDWKDNDTYEIWVIDGKCMYSTLVKEEDLNVTKTMSTESYAPFKINCSDLGNNIIIDAVNIYYTNLSGYGLNIANIFNVTDGQILLPPGIYNIQLSLYDNTTGDKYLALKRNYDTVKSNNNVTLIKSEFAKMGIQFDNPKNIPIKSASLKLLDWDLYEGDAFPVNFSDIANASLYVTNQGYRGYSVELDTGNNCVIKYSKPSSYLSPSDIIRISAKINAEFSLPYHSFLPNEYIYNRQFKLTDKYYNTVEIIKGNYILKVSNESESHDFLFSDKFMLPDISGVFDMSIAIENVPFEITLENKKIYIGSPIPSDIFGENKVSFLLKNCPQNIQAVKVSYNQYGTDSFYWENIPAIEEKIGDDILYTVGNVFGGKDKKYFTVWLTTGNSLYKYTLTQSDLNKTISLSKEDNLIPFTIDTSKLGQDVRVKSLSLLVNPTSDFDEVGNLTDIPYNSELPGQNICFLPEGSYTLKLNMIDASGNIYKAAIPDFQISKSNSVLNFTPKDFTKMSFEINNTSSNKMLSYTYRLYVKSAGRSDMDIAYSSTETARDVYFLKTKNYGYEMYLAFAEYGGEQKIHYKKRTPAIMEQNLVIKADTNFQAKFNLDKNIYKPGEKMFVGLYDIYNILVFDSFGNPLDIQPNLINNVIELDNGNTSHKYYFTPNDCEVIFPNDPDEYKMKYYIDGFPLPFIPCETTVYINNGNAISGYIKPDFITGKIDPRAINGFKVEIPDAQFFTHTDDRGYFEIVTTSLNIASKLKISKPGYLAREIPLTPSEGNISVSTAQSPISIFAGDLNINGKQDGSINMADIVKMATRFNTVSGNEGYSVECDFNMDNSINMADVIIIAKHFNCTSLDY